MRYASVCDGIGAAHVAWQPLGWECAWTSEIEPFPSAVVEQRWGFPNVGDMTAITEEMLDEHGSVNLLAGGTPCQSFSVAGLRGGLADPRGNLALRFVQFAAVMQPQWIVWENVPGVLSSGKGRDFGTFLGALGQLGYGFAYRVLDAQWFGVAQRRRRVFVVGYFGDWRRAAAVLFERESVFGNPPTRGKAWQGVARSTASSLTSSGRGVERCGESRGQDDIVLAAPEVANPLTARMGKGINTTCDEGQTAVVAFGGQMSEPQFDVDLSQTLQRKNPQAVAHTLKGRGWDGSEEGTGRGVPLVPSQGFTYSGYSNQPAWITGDRTDCLPASGHSDGSHQGVGIVAPMSVRRLTPRECERLQGFPDDYTLIEYRKKPAADGPRYKALGNSMAVPVMRWIGERIAQQEAT